MHVIVHVSEGERERERRGIVREGGKKKDISYQQKKKKEISYQQEDIRTSPPSYSLSSVGSTMFWRRGGS